MQNTLKKLMHGLWTLRNTPLPQWFKNPLVRGKYQVLPPPQIPSHIVRPEYVLSNNPTFEVRYEEPPKPQTLEAIQKLRVAARVASKTLEDTKNFIQEKGKNRQPLTEDDIDRFAFNSIIDQGAYPSSLGLKNFPKSISVSVNECIVNGIPSLRPLDFGDKINIDIAVYIDGYHGTNNLTVFYGEPEEKIKLKIAQVTQKALYQAISICKPGVPLNLVGKKIEQVAKQNELFVSSYFFGHGVGHLLFMPPKVKNTFDSKITQVIQEGQVFTIAPLLSFYPFDFVDLEYWQEKIFVIVCPNNPSSQFQHTLLIVKDGCQILTKRPSEKIPNPTKNIKNID